MATVRPDGSANAPVQLNLLMGDLEWTPPRELPDTLGDVISVDTETDDPELEDRGPSWAFDAGKCVGVSIASNCGFKAYFPLAHLGGGNVDNAWALRWLRHQIGDPTKKVVFMNATYDLGWLDRLGIQVNGEIHDVMLMAPLVYEHMWSYSLNSMLGFFLKQKKLNREIDQHLRDHGLKGKKNLWKLPGPKVGPYAEQDAAGPLALYYYLMEEIKKQELEQVYAVERGLIRCMYAMRKRGVRVDVAGAERLREKYIAKEREALELIRSETGVDIGPWDTDKLAVILEQRGVTVKKTEAGNWSMTKEWLAEMAGKGDQVCLALLTARKAQKNHSSFLEGFVLHYQHNGRIHAQYNQLKSDEGGTIGGRFSSSSPNMQQLPAREDEIAHEVRGLFLPEEGQLWAANDYSSQEPRLTVHWAARAGIPSGEDMAAKWRAEPRMDLHQQVADLCGISRKQAKTINLGMTYGMGGATMCENLGLGTVKTQDWKGRDKWVPGPEGEELIKKYHQNTPFIGGISQLCINRAKERGFIKTLLGRRCRFELGLNDDEWARKNEMDHVELLELRGERFTPEGQIKLRPGKWYRDTHKALNRLIQGSAADQTKKAMLDLFEAGVVPLVTVHDEIGFSVENKQQADEYARVMQDAVPLLVPNVVDVEVGVSWGDSMKKPEDREYHTRAGAVYTAAEK